MHKCHLNLQFLLSFPLLSSLPPPKSVQASQLQQVLSTSPPPSGSSHHHFSSDLFQNNAMELDLTSSPPSHNEPQPGALPHWFSTLGSCPVLQLLQLRCPPFTYQRPLHRCWPLPQKLISTVDPACHQHAKMTQQKAELLISNTFRSSPSSLLLLARIWLDWATLGSTAKEHWAYSAWAVCPAHAKRKGCR